MISWLLCLIFGFFLFFNIHMFWLINLFIFLVFMMYFLNSFILTDFFIYYNGLWIDLISFSLIILSFWITVLIYMARIKVFSSNSLSVFFMFFVYLLLLSLYISFSVRNLLSFYFFFEVSLIPTLIIIIGWGYQPERLQAGIYFLFYTLTASLPLFVVLFVIYKSIGSLEVILIEYKNLNFVGYIMFLGLIIAFLVKIPIFFTHLWLPRAHVEAPVAGSIILAGVLLKLGGYGLVRVSYIFSGLLFKFRGYLFGVRIMGMLYVGFICCRINDLKALVAYSSVAHMALVICGLFSYYTWGFRGALGIILSHGLSSSGLFCMVNLYYERLGRRRIYLMRGLILIMPLLSLIFFILCISNIAAPPTLNLLSEVFLIIGILKYDKLIFLVFPVASYLGALFTLYIFSFSQHGRFYLVKYSYFNPSYREFHLSALHIIPLNLVILKSEYLVCLV